MRFCMCVKKKGIYKVLGCEFSCEKIMIRPGSRATIEMGLVLLLFAIFSANKRLNGVRVTLIASEHAFLTIMVAAQADLIPSREIFSLFDWFE